MLKEEIKVGWNPPTFFTTIVWAFHGLGCDTKAPPASLLDRFEKTARLAFDFVDLLANSSRSMEVNQEGNLFALLDLVFPIDEEIGVERDGFLGEVIGELSHFDLGEELRHEKRGDDEERFHEVTN